MTREPELLRCPDHGDYTGKQQPHEPCLRCWRIFLEHGHGGDDDTGHVGVSEMGEILRAIERRIEEPPPAPLARMKQRLHDVITANQGLVRTFGELSRERIGKLELRVTELEKAGPDLIGLH